MSPTGDRGDADDAVGLCAGCAHAVRQRNRRGNDFWRCLAADRDERLLRYPPLPMRRCPAYEPGRPRASDPRGSSRA